MIVHPDLVSRQSFDNFTFAFSLFRVVEYHNIRKELEDLRKRKEQWIKASYTV